MRLLNQNNLINFIVLTLSVCMLSNYFLFFFFNTLIIKIIILIFFLTVLLFFISTKFNFFYLKLTFIVLSVLLLGNPTDTWDGWAVWMFKSKRIYFDKNFYGFLDNYASYSNNDQPLLIPALCTSIAFFFGKWNEIFPKLGVFFASFPVLIYSVNFFKNKWHFIFILFSLYIIANFFINAYLDGLVALYFSFCFLLNFSIFSSKKINIIEFFHLFLFTTILSLIKNEGLVLSFLIILQTVICIFLNNNKIINYRYVFYLFFSLVPLFFWKLLISVNNISNFHLKNGFDLFFNRIYEFDTYKIIFLFFINFKFLFILFFSIIASFFLQSLKIKLSIFFSFLYLSVVLTVNLISPMDFYWGMSASFKRILITPTYLMFVIVFFEIYSSKYKNINFIRKLLPR